MSNVNLKLPIEDVCEIIENPESHQRGLLVERMLTLVPGIHSAKIHKIMDTMGLDRIDSTVGQLKVRERIQLGKMIRDMGYSEGTRKAEHYDKDVTV